MINKERLLNTFLEYVQISGESRHEAAFAARLKADLEALGLEVYHKKLLPWRRWRHSLRSRRTGTTA